MAKDGWILIVVGISVAVAILMNRVKASQPSIPPEPKLPEPPEPPYIPPEFLYLISPIGGDPVTEMMCSNVVALVQDGKKYWLTPGEYAALGSLSYNEISLSTFHSYPDGTANIVVNGVAITARSTATICPCTPDWQCSEWSPCQNPGTGVWTNWRECEDINKCPETLDSTRTPPDHIKIETRPCSPPEVSVEKLTVDLILTSLSGNIYWEIYLGNPMSVSVYPVQFIFEIDGRNMGDPLGAQNIPANFPFRQFAAGGFTSSQYGNPGSHTVCISPKESTEPWDAVCKTVIV